MKKLLPLLALVLGIAFVASKFAPPRNHTDFDLIGFGRLPLLANGRVKPMDTLARSSLLLLQGRQRVSSPDISKPFVASPTEWLLDVFFHSEKADTYPTFAIDNIDLLALLGKSEETLTINYSSPVKKVLALVGFLPSRHRRFPFNDLIPHLNTLQEQARLADSVESVQRTAYQRALLQLRDKLVHYHRLKHAFMPPGEKDFLRQLLQMQAILPQGVAAIRAQQAEQPSADPAARAVLAFGQLALGLSQNSNLLVVPPTTSDTNPNAWRSTGGALIELLPTGTLPASTLAYAGLAHAWREQKAPEFNKVIELFRADLNNRIAPALKKSTQETRFNAAEPFYASMTLYVFAFFTAVFSWLKWPHVLGRSAFWLVLVAWLTATAGLAARMWLEGRPPVTNLYSSALFIGWGAVAFCLVLEAIFKNAVGNVAAGLIGFGTLLIAHHLSLSGDTLEMMRAVLDSNFWLATHVVIITTGYAATFLAGFLAIIYIFMGLFTKWLSKRPTPEGALAVSVVALSPTLTAVTTNVARQSDTNAQMISRMVYGIVCFATLFSLVGTVLGGIWADQSWGRFWGWDPKENGALIIVIWNAVILHSRWGGMIKQRGLMILAVFGNVVTSWSWFGTNMLGVGLHSYGFMDAAFWALIIFIASQLAIMASALVPLEKWRSFRTA